MPELAEDKRKQLDSIVGKMHVNNESDENIQTLVNDFKSKNSGPPEQPSAMSRFGTGLYNTTVGPVVNTAQSFIQHPIDTLSKISGADQIGAAYNQAKQGNYGQAALTLGRQTQDPLNISEGVIKPITQDIQQGNYAGAAGQATGIGAAMLVPEALGALGKTKFGGAVSSGVKAAAPDVGMGGLKAGAGAGVGYAAHEMGVPTGYAGVGSMYLSRPGLTQIGEGLSKGARAFGDAYKGPVKTPGPEPPPIPTKGPSVGQLKTAAMNGNITPEQFDASIDKMSDLMPDTKALHKSELRSSMQKVNPPSMGQTEKPLSLKTAKNAVKAEAHDIDWFKDKLKQQGHSNESIEEESAQLEREIEVEKATKEEAKAAKEAKSSSEPKKPKNQTKAPKMEVKPVSPEVKPPSMAPKMEVNPPGQTNSPEGIIDEATRGGPGTAPEMKVTPPGSNNKNLRSLMRPNTLETSGEFPVQPQSNANWGKVEAPGVNPQEQILNAIQKLQSGPGNYVGIDQLKAEIPNLTDKDILDLTDQGKLVTSRYDQPVNEIGR